MRKTVPPSRLSSKLRKIRTNMSQNNHVPDHEAEYGREHVYPRFYFDVNIRSCHSSDMLCILCTRSPSQSLDTSDTCSDDDSESVSRSRLSSNARSSEKPMPCTNWARGVCRRGSACRYAHNPDLKGTGKNAQKVRHGTNNKREHALEAITRSKTT